MPADIDTKPTTSQEPVEARSKEASDAASAPAEQRKEPWRDLPEFESNEDNVQVSKVRDMRLFGNHANGHS
ncbi:hypothetical protein B0I37DRAFT_449370 [Chaetomium sp. MPI-CAGE-AT-0009]|nr:hypothetical protein B0I37DRAFT_449370 [Chaetomium sp. MPI-CAGE-AT-0009]